MITSTQLKQITAEARPIIERQLDDALKLAALRDVVAAAGGDWSQLKALIKAQVKDEEAGDGKHVRKILDKAEYANAYADMLGLGDANMNEFISSDHSSRAAGEGVVTSSAGTEGEADRHPIRDTYSSAASGSSIAAGSGVTAGETAPHHIEVAA